MSALVCALIAVLSSAIIKVTLRFCMTKNISQWATLIFYNGLSTVLLFAFLDLPQFSSIEVWPAILLFLNGALWVVAEILDIKSYRHLDASVGELFGSFTFILLTLAGVVLFNETLSLVAILGIGLIIASVVYIGVPTRKVSVDGIRYKVLSTFFIAAAVIMNKYLCGFVDTRIVVLTGFLIPAVAYVAIGYRDIPQIVPALVQTRMRLMIVPILSAISYYYSTEAFAKGSMSLTTVIIQTCMVFVFVLEVIVLHARQDMLRRALACTGCVAGVVAVCFG